MVGISVHGYNLENLLGCAVELRSAKVEVKNT